jgi:D-xylose transport system substrate-binding protein
MAVGVAQGVQARGLEGKAYISGLDADVANDKLIVDGVISRSVWTKIDEMGHHAVIAAAALAQGQEPPTDGFVNNGLKDVPSALVAVEAVTADNMCEWITTGAPEGWVSIEDVFGDADACAGAAAGADWSVPETPAEKLTLGVSMRTETQPRWQFDVASMQAMADQIGNVELLVQWPADDPVRQAAQVENLLTQGIDALILVATDDKAVIPLVGKADEAGVPFICYDTSVPDSDVDYFVTRDNREVGRLQVQGALDFAPPNVDDPPKYALIKGDPDNNVGRGIAAAYEEFLAPYIEEGSVEIVGDQWHANWSGELALKTVEAVLAAQSDDVQAFITSNDSMAVGVAQGVQGRGLAGKVYISGLDADVTNDKLIVEGVITNSVWTRLDVEAYHAVIAAVLLAQGLEPPIDSYTNNGYKDVPTSLIEVMAVTKDNMCDWITTVAPDGWVTVEDVYGDPNACD